MDNSHKKSFEKSPPGYCGGPNFIHAHPPTPENTRLGVRGIQQMGGGGSTIPAGGGLRNIHPPPSPAKKTSGQK